MICGGSYRGRVLENPVAWGFFVSKGVERPAFGAK